MRIAIGGFQHETNTFAPEKAQYQDFVQADGWPGLVEGEEIYGAVEGVNLGISGFISQSKRLGYSLAPLLWCSATPSSYVTFDTFERISGSMLDRLANSLPVDAVYIDLHGAMVIEHHQDGEGELLARVRSLIGRDVPLIASLDLHANVTSRMVSESDALVAYRTYPHIDMYDSGQRAVGLLGKILESGGPMKAFRKLEFLIPLVWQCTLSDPCKGIYQKLKELEKEHDELWSLSFATGFPPADIHEVGPAIVGYGEDQKVVDAAADELCELVSLSETKFTGQIYTPDQAVQYAMKSKVSPVIISDTQDNPGAGGNSDTLGLLRALINAGANSAVFGLIYDPEIASLAHRAGTGHKIVASLGAGSSWKGEVPLEQEFYIQNLGDGSFTGTGPMFGGANMELGRMAVLRLGDVEILVSSKKMQLADQAIFKHLEIDPKSRKILVLKSSVHFRADFTELAGEIIIAEAPGPNAVNHLAMPFKNVRPNVRLVPGGPTLGN